MMFVREDLPLLPGTSSNNKIGCEKWHKSSQFEWMQGKVPCLVEQKRPLTAATYPFPLYSSGSQFSSLYPKRQNCELPAWVLHDKQVLSFDACYEDQYENQKSGFRTRKVKINFFLEDGTMQVNEQKMKNSGFLQGTLLGRRRIPFPKPMDKAFYEVIDLNVGKTLEFYGRKYFIFNCDKFTRHWLNRSGIAVPEPINMTQENAERPKIVPDTTRATSAKPDKLGQFLQFDGHVLRFYGYWDDRKSEGGYIHKFILQYYLSDDTLDVREEGGSLLLARKRLPKTTATLAEPGQTDPTNLLNVLTTGYLKGRVVKDAKNVGALKDQYYSDSDLLPGVVVNVFGRAVVLTHCDKFTEDFYRSKYGIDHFKYDPTPVESNDYPAISHELPPWNGFGTFEDSASNCLHLIPKATVSVAQKLEKSRYGFDSNILRFRARILTDKEDDRDRNFVVSFYLADNTTSVYEDAGRNSGFEKKMLIKRKEAFKPTENLFVSRKPEIYTTQDFWVGNILDIDHSKFELLEADEYTMRFMEINSQEFTKSNIEYILDKLRAKLETGYKAFVKNYLMVDGGNVISREALSEALKTLMGGDITPHEILTLTRHFAYHKQKKRFDKEKIRDVCRSECRRLLFNGFDRFEENLCQRDVMNTGHLPRDVVYCLCRGAKLPVDSTLLDVILDEVDKNEKGEIKISDLLSFFDPHQNPCSSIVPFNHVREFTDKSSAVKGVPGQVDCLKLIEKLQLEEKLTKMEG